MPDTTQPLQQSPSFPHVNPNLESSTTILLRLQRVLLESLDFNQVVQKIVDELLDQSGFKELGYRIIVLNLVNQEKHVLQRISLSTTAEAAKAQEVSAVPFHDIEIPLTAEKNLLVKCFNEQKPMLTHFWPDLFVPVLTVPEAQTNQIAAGIKTSLVYPIVVSGKSIGVLIFSLIKDVDEVSQEEEQVLYSFADVVGIAVQNSQLFRSAQQTSESLKQANIQIGLTGKLKDNLITMASHEFRTPLTSMKNMLWALDKPEIQDKLSDKSKQYYTRLKGSVDRLGYVVENINQMLRATSGNLEDTLQFTSVQIEKVISQVLEDKDIEAKDALVTVTYKEPANVLPPLEADAIKIQYIMYELITNALKYTDKGGSITITSELQNNNIVIKVTDTGHGIPAEKIPVLFQGQGFDKPDPMHTTQSGMGLGLYLVDRIIKLHKGQIGVESTVGKGTTITLTLPIIKQPQPQTQPQTPPTV